MFLYITIIMARARENVLKMKEKGRVVEKKYFDTIGVFEFLHGCSAIVDSDNLERMKRRWLEQRSVKYKYYQIYKIGKESTISNNDEFGFNLRLIKPDLKEFKIDNIWIPDKWCPCYINIGDGFFYILAPFKYTEERQKETRLKLSKPQKALSSFW